MIPDSLNNPDLYPFPHHLAFQSSEPTSAGSTVVEPETETETQTEEEKEKQYAIILFDDDTHSYAYVVEMMMSLFGKTATEGYEIAYNIDHIGQATVKICGKDEALKGKAAIAAYGPDPRMETSVGSMGVCIEPVS